MPILLSEVALQRSEKAVAQRLLNSDSNYRYFLVPLQTCGDAQIKVHSRFRSIPRFIEHVLYSFARSAPADAALVIKHHPLDRGYTDYSILIARLAKRLGLESRCHYIHDQHLPTLLRKAEGVVVVNSTVGLSAVGEGVPVKVCGEAIYDMSGLTFQGGLDGFWEGAAAFRADGELWNAFRTYLISRTQINGSFYRKIAGIGSRSRGGLGVPGRRSGRACASSRDAGWQRGRNCRLARGLQRRLPRRLRPARIDPGRSGHRGTRLGELALRQRQPRHAHLAAYR